MVVDICSWCIAGKSAGITKRTTWFFSLARPRSLIRFMRKKAGASSVSQRSHSATYTHLSHAALCTICNRTCKLAQERTRPILQRAQPTQVAHSCCHTYSDTHTHTHINILVLLSLWRLLLGECVTQLFTLTRSIPTKPLTWTLILTNQNPILTSP